MKKRKSFSMRIGNIFGSLWQFTLLLIVLCLMAGSAYHLFLGSNGLEVMEEIRGNIDISQRELKTVQDEYKQLYLRISLLSKDQPDLDLLEERVRDILDYGKSGEAIIHYKSVN